jgi:hypothetical protein
MLRSHNHKQCERETHTLFFRNSRASRLQEKLEKTEFECSSTATLRSFNFIDCDGVWNEQESVNIIIHQLKAHEILTKKRLYLTKYSFAKFLDPGFGSSIHVKFEFCVFHNVSRLCIVNRLLLIIIIFDF